MQMILKVLFILMFSAHLEAVALKQDETIIFFPTPAYLTAQGWQIQIHGWIYEPQWALFQYLPADLQPSLFKQRMQAF